MLGRFTKRELQIRLSAKNVEGDHLTLVLIIISPQSVALIADGKSLSTTDSLGRLPLAGGGRVTSPRAFPILDWFIIIVIGEEMKTVDLEINAMEVFVKSSPHQADVDVKLMSVTIAMIVERIGSDTLLAVIGRKKVEAWLGENQTGDLQSYRQYTYGHLCQ